MKRKMLVRSLIVAGMFSAATVGGYIAQNNSYLHSAIAAGVSAPAAVVNAQPGARVKIHEPSTRKFARSKFYPVALNHEVNSKSAISGSFIPD